MSADKDGVERQDALDFLGDACRNWSHIGPLSDDDVSDVADALRRFVAKRTRPTPAQEQGWMPIETAPRDGWKILATDRFHQERTWVVWWKGNEWVCDHHNGRVVGLTDWRPLPSTPTEGAQ